MQTIKQKLNHRVVYVIMKQYFQILGLKRIERVLPVGTSLTVVGQVI